MPDEILVALHESLRRLRERIAEQRIWHQEFSRECVRLYLFARTRQCRVAHVDLDVFMDFVVEDHRTAAVQRQMANLVCNRESLPRRPVVLVHTDDDLWAIAVEHPGDGALVRDLADLRAKPLGDCVHIDGSLLDAGPAEDLGSGALSETHVLPR